MKTSDPEVLIRELYDNASVSGQQPLERRLAELTMWYYKNKKRISPENLPAKVAFLEKALWISLEVTALAVERLHSAKGGASRLWVPNGIKVDGKHHFTG